MDGDMRQKISHQMGEAIWRGKAREFKARCKLLDARLKLISLELELALHGRCVGS